AQAPDLVAVNRILDQGMNHSQVMATAAYLTDRIGGRLTNSPQMREAEAWTQQQFRDWGLSNVRAEGFEFGRGWSIVRSSARMIAPRTMDLRAIPVAWTPSTDGVISGEVVLAPMSRAADFERWRGKLSGKIVMISEPREPEPPTTAAVRRWTGGEPAGRTPYVQPDHSPAAVQRGLGRERLGLEMAAVLAEGGALGRVRMSYRYGGLLHGTAYTHRLGATPRLAGLELAAEDYRRLVRLSRAGTAPRLELLSEVRF